jgi:hypothetical protein
MNELKRLFDIAPENIHSMVRFGNVRDEIIRLSKEGNMTRLSSGRKIRASPPICWDQMRNLSALRHDSGVSRSLNPSPHPKGAANITLR